MSRKGEKIDAEILKILRESTTPTSTRELALKTGRAWHSIQMHCLKLQIANKITGFTVGGMNLWQLKRHK